MSKLPAFQFYPGDWRKDPGVQSLSFHDRGVWFEIILLMHESEQRGKLLLNGRPMPESALARLLGLDNQILTTTLTTLFEFGVASRCDESGAIMCRRMVRDENLREVRKKAGKLGGNPNLVKQKPTTMVKQKPTTMVKQKPTPSSSSSDEDGVSSERKKRICTSVRDDQFDDFWKTYPRRTAKGQARKAWSTALQKVDAETILVAAERYAKQQRGKDQQFVRHPATWLNGECWEDETLKPKERCPWYGLRGEELEKWARENVETV